MERNIKIKYLSINAVDTIESLKGKYLVETLEATHPLNILPTISLS